MIRLFLLIFFVIALPAFAESYKYTDKIGIVFWVDSISKIPPQYRSEALKGAQKAVSTPEYKGPPLLPEQIKYTDRNGITFWVDSLSEVPPQYRGQPQDPQLENQTTKTQTVIEKPKRYSKLRIANNQIIVKVNFTNNGHKTSAYMILDTGASSTVIYPSLARRLGLHGNRVSVGYSKIADGSQVASYLTKINLIEVDDSILSNPEVVIMSSTSNMGAEGLLGNSFLKYFHFSIDYDRQLLIWD